VIAWARVACAHHYPTDLLAGSTLGCLTAYASSALVQTFWTL
jgi:membrane-associated phospholipid phosphatase